MGFIKTLALVSMLSLASTSCVTTQEMPLAPNVVRLDTRASGWLFTGQATNQTMSRAAELTLQNGYTHFRFDQASVQQGSQLAGVYTSGNATAFGSPNFASVNGSTMSSPIYRSTANIGVTVYMFRANEPGAKGAFDAAEVLKRMAS